MFFSILCHFSLSYCIISSPYHGKKRKHGWNYSDFYIIPLVKTKELHQYIWIPWKDLNQLQMIHLSLEKISCVSDDFLVLFSLFWIWLVKFIPLVVSSPLSTLNLNAWSWTPLKKKAIPHMTALTFNFKTMNLKWGLNVARETPHRSWVYVFCYPPKQLFCIFFFHLEILPIPPL